jgi:hypothetical protein
MLLKDREDETPLLKVWHLCGPFKKYPPENPAAGFSSRFFIK